MTTFDDRERAFENLFAHDQESAFRARARRDRELGLWAARLLGLEGGDAERYADELVALAIASGGDDAIAAKLGEDLSRRGPHMTEQGIRQRMGDLMSEALADAKRG